VASVTGRPAAGPFAAALALAVSAGTTCGVEGPGPTAMTPPPGPDRLPPGRVVAWRAALIVAVVLLFVAFGEAFGQVPEVPDPQVWARLSPQEQAARRAEIAAQLRQASPEQRETFRRALRERLEGLSPQERQALAGQARERWAQLPPEERARLQAERRQRLESMSRAERRQLLQQRRAILERLGPDERAALREPLPAP
jgi:hypothetical protein